MSEQEFALAVEKEGKTGTDHVSQTSETFRDLE